MRKKSFDARIWAKLVAYQKKERLLSPSQGVLVAISGGPDSVCLAHYLFSMRRRIGFKMELAYVDHGLRKAAIHEAGYVQTLSKAWDIPVSILFVDAAKEAKERGGGLEEACRRLRYQVLATRAQKIGFDLVAVGQHMGDQAETVLLNLLRGTRLSALAAMSPKRALTKKIILIRPLLPLKRDEILDYLKIHGLKFKTDETNRDLDMTRNWIRRKVMPLLETQNPRIQEHLSGIAEQVQGLNLCR
jgi:tRNA(Ile)-lysidine synthase